MGVESTLHQIRIEGIPLYENIRVDQVSHQEKIQNQHSK